MSKIIILYPQDSSTDFLQEVVNQAQEKLTIELMRPNASIQEHEDALNTINVKSSGLVLFMGHGQSDKLLGSAVVDFEDKEYKIYKEKGFINNDNIAVFQNKKVICLSCDSNKKVGKIAIEKGALAFVGFGNISTDWITAVEEVASLQSSEVEYFNELLVQIFTDSLIYSIHNSFNFSQFEKIFKIITNKKIFELINNGYESNDWIIQNLYNLKDEIKVFGDKTLQLI